MMGKRKEEKERREQDQLISGLIKMTENRMREKSLSYEKLGEVLKKMPKCSWKLREEEVYRILGKVSIGICGTCENFHVCYETEKEEIMEEVKGMLLQMEENRNEIKIPVSFEQRCRQAGSFLKELEESYELAVINRNWKNRMLYQRQVLSMHMKTLSRQCLNDADWLKEGILCEKKTDLRLKYFLKKENLIPGSFRLYENADKRKEVFLMASSRKGRYPADRLAELLGDCLKTGMVPDENCPPFVYEETHLFHFVEDASYRALTGVFQKNKDGEKVSGDLFSILRTEHGKEYFLMTDGMGSGEEAMEEGKQTIELMEQLLLSGFHEEETLKLVNSAITFGLERGMYSSVDLMSLNLYTGVLKIMKAGSAATFLIRRGKVEVIESKALPAGLLWEIEFDVLYKKLYDGDTLILVSDGILDNMEGADPEQKIREWLPSVYGRNPGQSAEKIVKWSLEQAGGKRKDDLSAMVIQIWKKKRFRKQNR